MGHNSNVEDRQFNANVDDTTRQGNTWVPGESLPEPPPALTGITVTPATIDAQPGAMVQLEVAPQPEGASLAGPTAASSDEAVATVDGGLMVTAVADGTCTVTVTDGAVSATVAVTVTTVEE